MMGELTLGSIGDGSQGVMIVLTLGSIGDGSQGVMGAVLKVGMGQ